MTQSYGWNLQRLQHSRNDNNPSPSFLASANQSCPSTPPLSILAELLTQPGRSRSSTLLDGGMIVLHNTGPWFTVQVQQHSRRQSACSERAASMTWSEEDRRRLVNTVLLLTPYLWMRYLQKRLSIELSVVSMTWLTDNSRRRKCFTISWSRHSTIITANNLTIAQVQNTAKNKQITAEQTAKLNWEGLYISSFFRYFALLCAKIWF